MNKRIKKQFWLSLQEVKELKSKAEIAGISEAAVIRLLIRGYGPREKPDSSFYEAMRKLSAILLCDPPDICATRFFDRDDPEKKFMMEQIQLCPGNGGKEKPHLPCPFRQPIPG